MKAKIDLEKFICSWLKARGYCSDNESWYVIAALREQGLDYNFENGEIVEIEQEDLRKWLNFEKTHEGITIHKDLKGTDPDGGVVGEKGESRESPKFNKERLFEVAKPETPEEKADAEERKNLRKRYKNIAESEWFKKNHKDVSVNEGNDVTMAVYADEQAIIDRLDKIIELLSWKQSPNITPYPYIPHIIYKRPLDPDPNILGGWTTTASTEGGEG